MTGPLLISLTFAVLAAALSVALTKSVMTLFAKNLIDGVFDEDFRLVHGVTIGESVIMAALAFTTTMALSLSFGTGTASLLFALLAGVGVSLCYTDFLEHLLFNIVVYPFGALTVLGLFLYWHVNNLGGDFLLGALNGGLFSLLLYLVMWVLSGYRLGFGDVRLSAPIGAIAGAFGAGLPVAAIAAANVLALSVIIVTNLIQAFSRSDLRSHIAFGPFMIFGLVLALVLRAPVMEWWHTNMAAVVWLVSGMPM